MNRLQRSRVKSSVTSQPDRGNEHHTRSSRGAVGIRRFVTLTAALLSTTCLTGADWLQFRGNDVLGVSSLSEIPLTWSDSENIAWKVPLPGRGLSGAIVIRDRVVLTASSAMVEIANLRLSWFFSSDPVDAGGRVDHQYRLDLGACRRSLDGALQCLQGLCARPDAIDCRRSWAGYPLQCDLSRLDRNRHAGRTLGATMTHEVKRATKLQIQKHHDCRGLARDLAEMRRTKRDGAAGRLSW